MSQGRDDLLKVLDLAINTSETIVKRNELLADNLSMLEINVLYFLFDLFKAENEDDLKEVCRLFETFEAREAGIFLAKQRKFYLN